jgi:hypothetical protein
MVVASWCCPCDLRPPGSTYPVNLYVPRLERPALVGGRPVGDVSPALRRGCVPASLVRLAGLADVDDPSLECCSLHCTCTRPTEGAAVVRGPRLPLVSCVLLRRPLLDAARGLIDAAPPAARCCTVPRPLPRVSYRAGCALLPRVSYAMSPRRCSLRNRSASPWRCGCCPMLPHASRLPLSRARRLGAPPDARGFSAPASPFSHACCTCCSWRAASRFRASVLAAAPRRTQLHLARRA